MSGDDHPASRPSWRCANPTCRKPWPCDPAREQLAAEMDSIDLAMCMATTMVHVAREDPSIRPSELFERFLGWTRGPRPGVAR